MDLVNNPLVLTAIIAAWGLLVRFYPPLKAWPSYIIPYGNLFIALLVKLTAPADALAAVGPDAIAVAAAGGEVSIWSRLFAAVIQALGNTLVYDKFLKAPAIKTLGTAKEKKAHIGTVALLGLLLVGSSAQAGPRTEGEQRVEPQRVRAAGSARQPWLSKSRLSLSLGAGVSTTRPVFCEAGAYRGIVAIEGGYRIAKHVKLTARGSGRPGFIEDSQDSERRAEGMVWLSF